MQRLLIGGGIALLAFASWASQGLQAADAPAAAKADKKIVLGPEASELTSGIPGKGAITAAELQAWLNNPKNHEPIEFDLPLGLAAGASQIRGVEANPLTRAKIELGRQLYFDNRLSGDQTISCASCHDPKFAYAFNTQFGVGIRGLKGNRNSPPAYNRILSDVQFWDGRAGSLEEQALGPIANDIEMGGAHDACVTCLAGIPGYQQQFDKIFGGLTIENVGKAIATFERTLVTGPSPWDYYEQLVPFRDVDLEALEEESPEAFARYKELLAASEAHPMSDSAKRGRDLFFNDKGGCSACHVGANLTDEKFHNLGVGMAAAEPDLGRFVVSGEEKDKGAFKTPTVRNIAHSGPYMHDGSQQTLAEVVEWYAKGGHPNQWLDEKVKKLDLTAQDKADLVAFMEACTGEFPKVERERLPK